jgi:ribosomal protein L11 methyltransferase
VSAPLVRLSIRVHADRAETALADLLPLLGRGAEERDLGTSVEYAIYLPEGEVPPADAIRRLAGDALVGTLIEPVPDGWDRRHLEHLRRSEVAGLTIRAPWLEGEPGDLIIDPSTTFGAGTHESTRLSLELLAGMEPGGALCDWGAGSGILAIAAARLGWDPVIALELDPDAREVIEANARANSVRVDVRTADLLRDDLPEVATVVANLTPALHEGVAARIAPRAAPGAAPGAALGAGPRRIVAAGFLSRYADDVAALYAPLREIRRAVDGEWAALELAP